MGTTEQDVLGHVMKRGEDLCEDAEGHFTKRG